MTGELCPNLVHLEPELASLAVLDAALMAARAARLAEHPDAGEYGLYGPGPLPPLVVIAVLVVERTAELRRLLTRYRRALDDFRADEDHRQAEFPF